LGEWAESSDLRLNRSVLDQGELTKSLVNLPRETSKTSSAPAHHGEDADRFFSFTPR
jgi:hypothetical protein